MLIGAPPDAEPLPQYSQQADFLSPSHCRLCLTEVQDLEAHLSSAHPDVPGIEAYRRLCLQKALSEWPQAISPQVLRSRLAAFKTEMCDANFAMSSCASCTRQKRRCKLFAVIFPNSNSDTCPSWLPWDQKAWQRNREEWYKHVDGVLNIENYMSVFFRTHERLDAAKMEVAAFDAETD